MESTPLFDATGRSNRKILRIPTKEKDVGHSSEQLPITVWAGGSSNQPNGHDPSSGSNQTNDQDPSSRSIIGEEVPHDSRNNMPRISVPRFSFGPFYVVGLPSVMATKDKAWEHVLRNSGEEDTSVTREAYTAAVSKVHIQAEETFDGTLSVDGPDFRLMMIKDGCLFLQFALLILGATPEELLYTPSDPIFGIKQNKKDVKMWIESMFFTGNQIPLVVLEELMNQRYFQKIIRKVKWDPSPSCLYKRVLYELLILPAVKKRSLRSRFMGRDDSFGLNRPCDMLHGLENLVFGIEQPGRHLNHDSEAVDDEDLDLEANEEKINIREETVTADKGDWTRVLPNATELTSGVGADINQARLFPSATDLSQACISIEKLETGGTRSIYLKSCWLCAKLYLPRLSVDEHTELIFQNLKTYENIQQLGKQKHHFHSYLKLMSELIQTKKDVKLLEDAGIIAGSPHVKEKLPRMLCRLSSDVKTLTQEFRILRGEISDYSSPMINVKKILKGVAFLSLLQLIMSVVAYANPRK